jgi:hypothetical protein
MKRERERESAMTVNYGKKRERKRHGWNDLHVAFFLSFFI